MKNELFGGVWRGGTVGDSSVAHMTANQRQMDALVLLEVSSGYRGAFLAAVATFLLIENDN